MTWVNIIITSWKYTYNVQGLLWGLICYKNFALISFVQHSYNLLLIYVYNLLVNYKHKFVHKSFDTASFLLFCLIENFSLFWWHLHYYDIIYWGSYTAECQTRYKALICRECCRLSYPFNTRIDQHDMTCWLILLNSPHEKIQLNPANKL